MRRAAESWFVKLNEQLQSHFLGWKVELEKLNQEWELEQRTGVLELQTGSFMHILLCAGLNYL